MTRKHIVILVVIILCLALASTTLAIPTILHVPWWTVDSGGGRSNGGSYTLTGTIGQAEGGAMQGGSYTLSNGFWKGGMIAEAYESFLPMIQH